MTRIIAIALLAGFAALPAQAGCLTGAAVGGVAGHVAGHHGVLGAAAGCAVGHHEANKEKKAEAQQHATTTNGQPAPTQSQ